MAKNEILLEWVEPAVVCQQASKELRKGNLKRLMLLVVIAAVFMAAVYIAVRQLPLDNTEFYDEFPHAVVLLLMMLAVVFGYPYVVRYAPQTIRISERGIQSSGLNTISYRWDQITDNAIEDSAKFSGHSILAFKRQRKRRYVHLPDDFSREQILSILAARVVKQDVPLRPNIEFSRGDWVYMVMFVLACCVILLYFGTDILQVLHDTGEWAFPAAVIALFGIGPGTLAVVQVKGLKGLSKGSCGAFYAMVLNMVTSCILSLCGPWLCNTSSSTACFKDHRQDKRIADEILMEWTEPKVVRRMASQLACRQFAPTIPRLISDLKRAGDGSYLCHEAVAY